MKKMPVKIQKEVKATVYKKADEHGYLHRGRIENGIFMDNLVKDPNVGGKLSEYINKSELKTYIKDAILNRYSKDKTAVVLDADLKDIISNQFNQKSELIERRNNGRIALHRLENNDLLLVSGGTFLKWETALRKALEFIAQAPGLPPVDVKLHILLNLATVGGAITDSDKKALRVALEFLNLHASFRETL